MLFQTLVANSPIVLNVGDLVNMLSKTDELYVWEFVKSRGWQL